MRPDKLHMNFIRTHTKTQVLIHPKDIYTLKELIMKTNYLNQANMKSKKEM